MKTTLFHSHIFRTLSLVGVASLTNLSFVTSARAMDLILNGGFENDLNGWQTLGDTSTQGNF